MADGQMAGMMARWQDDSSRLWTKRNVNSAIPEMNKQNNSST
jgi:hypothetical protein